MKKPNTTKIFGGLIAIVIMFTIIMISISGNQAPQGQQAHYTNDNAAADNKVEALKTMTANLLAVEQKNEALSASIKTLKEDNKKTISELQDKINQKLDAAVKIIKNNKVQDNKTIPIINPYQQQALQDYPIQNQIDDNEDHNELTWVNDISKPNDENSTLTQQSDNNKNINFWGDSKQSSKINHKLNEPRYTIPTNATLTGATLMTPLVGRVPIDGNLPSPYHFKLVLSAKNLTANGYPLPGIKGAVMSGIASGDMLGRCARGDVTSITFIFNDGTISSTNSKDSHQSLGYLSSQTGNPCLPGEFHSNAAVFLGSQMGLAGLQGYANAISSSQYLNQTTSEGQTLSSLMGNANRAGIGQGLSAAAQAAQTWWNRRVQNSFDFIYVPNVDAKTHKAMKVVVNITQAINIDKNSTARKVDYEDKQDTAATQLD